MSKKINLVAVAVAVATTDEVLRVRVGDAETLGLLVKNSGANALDAFEVWGSFKDDQLYASGDQTTQVGVVTDVKLLSIGTDFTTPVYPLVKASASPVTLAAAANVWMAIDVRAFATISVRASSAVGVTTVDFEGSVK